MCVWKNQKYQKLQSIIETWKINICSGGNGAANANVIGLFCWVIIFHSFFRSCIPPTSKTHRSTKKSVDYTIYTQRKDFSVVLTFDTKNKMHRHLSARRATSWLTLETRTLSLSAWVREHALQREHKNVQSVKRVFDNPFFLSIKLSLTQNHRIFPKKISYSIWTLIC